MARAALRWTVRELADKARINHNTVIRFENERHDPNDTTRVMIEQAFEAGGLVFVDADEAAGEGVRLKASAEAREPDEEQQAVEESAASLLAREEGLRASKRKGKV
jgi:transcriptional regulator with XRE-family HTH domain